MNRRDLLTLFSLALIVRLLTGSPYMDAYYYTSGAYRLAEGHPVENAGVGAVALGYIVAAKVTAWRDDDVAYRERIRMVGNPPDFWYHTHRPAVVVPNGDAETLLAAADRYGARYVLLDWTLPAVLAGFYTEEASHSRLRPVEV